MTAEIICVGTEILLGNAVNECGAYIARKCAGFGLSVRSHTILGDDDGFAEAFKTALERSDMVFLWSARPDETVLTAASDADRSVTSLYNDGGGLSGMLAEDGGHCAAVLSGKLSELIPVFDKYVAPCIRKRLGGGFCSASVKVCGVKNEVLNTKLSNLTDGHAPLIFTRPETERAEIYVTAAAADDSEARELVKPAVKEIKARFGSAVFSTDESEDIEDAVVKLLKKYGLRVSVAESCTGGLVAAKLVNVSGASEVFTHGFITYTNKAKRKILGVNRDTLKKYSAVSREVAKEMAKGCVFTADSDVSVAVTGYAGPEDSKEEPKGLVFIACSVKDKVIVEKYNFSGDRSEIREAAAVRALDLLRTSILSAYK